MSENRPLIVFGTGNRKKGIELGEVFAPLGLCLKTLADYPAAIQVVEDGDSFAANAALKATGQAKHLGLWVLGEDSGLMVDALGGAPGVYSARFSGENANDTSNNRLLLEQLSGVSLEKRGARYACHMALSDPSGRIHARSAGYCGGRILFEPEGCGGFGYDPLFEVVEYHRTFGVLSPLVKRVLSHRARAARHFIPQLRKLIADGTLG